MSTEKTILWIGRTVIGTVLVGIVSFVGHFFFNQYPELRAEVFGLKNTNEIIRENLVEIKTDVKEMRKRQEEFLEKILRRGR